MALIPNNGWETGDAGGWTLVNGGGGESFQYCQVKTTTPRSGLYHLEIKNSDAYSPDPSATYNLPSYATWIGYTVIWKGRARGAGGSGGNLLVTISDGVGSDSDNSLSYSVTTYTDITVSLVVDAGATRPAPIHVEDSEQIQTLHGSPRSSESQTRTSSSSR